MIMHYSNLVLLKAKGEQDFTNKYHYYLCINLKTVLLRPGLNRWSWSVHRMLWS